MGREPVDTEYKLPSLFGGALLTSSQGTLSQIEGKTKLCSGDTDPGYSNQHGRGLVTLLAAVSCEMAPTPTLDLGTQDSATSQHQMWQETTVPSETF